MELIDGPRSEWRARTPTLGIRVVTPFRGMLAERDRLLSELSAWLADGAIETDGPFFLRLHVVDMAGEMDIEVGVAGVDHPGDERVRSGVMPAGTYALLAYRRSSLEANRTLQAWAQERELSFAVQTEPDGDHWTGRFEILRTDPRREPRKTRWVTELAFLLR